MPVVIDPPASPPVTPPAEGAYNLWELIYESLGFHREDDPATGYQLQKLCESLCNPYQPFYDLVRERDNQQGWAVLFDPDNCPERWLAFLSQLDGVRLTAEMTVEQQRGEIKAPTGWRRGQPETIRTATRRTLVPTNPEELARVIIRPRTPEPGMHQVRTWLSQTPDPTRTEQVIRENLAAWEMLEYQAVTGMTYADVKAEEETYAAVKADFATYKDLVEALP